MQSETALKEETTLEDLKAGARKLVSKQDYKDLFPAILFFLKKFSIAWIVILLLIAIITPLIVLSAKLITYEIQFFWNNIF